MGDLYALESGPHPECSHSTRPRPSLQSCNSPSHAIFCLLLHESPLRLRFHDITMPTSANRSRAIPAVSEDRHPRFTSEPRKRPRTCCQWPLADITTVSLPVAFFQINPFFSQSDDTCCCGVAPVRLPVSEVFTPWNC